MIVSHDLWAHRFVFEQTFRGIFRRLFFLQCLRSRDKGRATIRGKDQRDVAFQLALLTPDQGLIDLFLKVGHPINAAPLVLRVAWPSVCIISASIANKSSFSSCGHSSSTISTQAINFFRRTRSCPPKARESVEAAIPARRATSSEQTPTMAQARSKYIPDTFLRS
jgi:hypothetical protein